MHSYPPALEISWKHHFFALLEQMQLACKQYMPHVSQLRNKIKILIKALDDFTKY